MTAATRNPRVCVIGAGMAGIATAHTFVQAGFTDLVVLEKGSDVGGVWHWNRYPGLTCDVPSQIYQLSFALKPDWSQVCATGEEIQRYHRDVVDRLGLDKYIRLNSEVVAAEFTGGRWRVETRDGHVEEADFVVCATGVLHHPAVPNIPGLESFEGPVVHTARWDDSVATEGKRIAVIGTGSTGVQVVSALQPAARSIAHFVRSPQWVIWAPMTVRQPRLVSRVLAGAPLLRRAVYAVALQAANLFTDVVIRPSWRRKLVQAYARLSLRVLVRDRALREKLTPDYQPLCKRQVVSGTYYRTIVKPNAELVTEGVASVTPTGIRTDDGRERPVDVIVLATGFKAHNYMRPMDLRGKDGLSIDEAWADGPRAYQMTAIPGFPNLFTVLGPNSPTGSVPLQYSAELTAKYITHWLRRFRDDGVRTVEVTDAAAKHFNEGVAEALGPTVWNTGCNSWYFNQDGSVDLWPYDRKTMKAMLTAPDESDYEVTYESEEPSRRERARSASTE
ncbi:MAG: flavin-containing monooxygenase [Segniliparus sp.]|uniref:flavin-containing monooxygenase n=1 Tax=Segniliparus sp. TaxID=2804064 RepID=UPI003F2D5537